jgi:hypothetical protein
MLVQPFNDGRPDGSIPYSAIGGLAIVLVRLIVPEIEAVRAARECCQEISLCRADPTNKGGGDRGPASAQNETVARRLDRRPDPGEVLEEIVGNDHIAASSPGGTASLPKASGIGPIGPSRAGPAASVGPSVL